MKTKLQIAICLTLIMLAWTHAAASDLPPNPGEVGNNTIAGVDSDHDGVRDDVQRYIEQSHPESQKVRSALRQLAKAMQRQLIDSEDSQKSIANNKNILDVMNCFMNVLPLAERGKELTALEARMRNTEARLNAYVKANSYQSTVFYTMPSGDKWKSFCDFNPDVMPD